MYNIEDIRNTDKLKKILKGNTKEDCLIEVDTGILEAVYHPQKSEKTYIVKFYAYWENSNRTYYYSDGDETQKPNDFTPYINFDEIRKVIEDALD